MFTKRTARMRLLALAVSALAAVSLAACTQTKVGGSGSGSGGDKGDIKIGFVVKTMSNPFWVFMVKKAKEEAKKLGVTLITAAGKEDGDNESQVNAIQNMMTSQVDAIIIDPNDSTAIVPTLKKAQKQGIYTLAVDTETKDDQGVSGTWATDNKKGGVLLGKYLRAALGDVEPRVALLDLQHGITVGDQRRNGFLKGFGIAADSPEVVGMQPTNGDQHKGQVAMENMLQKAPGINVVYSINEPAGTGGATAIANAGKTDSILLGSIDGSCSGVDMVKSGAFTATVMQFPAKMATESIDAAVAHIKKGKDVEMPSSGYIDTGTVLITNKPIEGIDSKGTDWGAEHCWGTK